jgi:lipid-A-disaccharide synthase
MTRSPVQVVTNESVVIGLVVGEASGDILGAGLMTALSGYFPQARFVGLGGPRMKALGFHSFFDMERLSVMGLVEPLKRLPELLQMRKALADHFLNERPILFVGIDSPDFNLTLEGKLKQAGIPTVHYVSPSVWAWRQKRIIKIKKSVDLMLTLLPFEAAFYQQHAMPVHFVGHPLADQFPLQADDQQARASLSELLADDRFDPHKKTVALMPGSRGGEVKLLGPVFLQAAEICLQFQSDLQFVIPAANAERFEQLKHLMAGYDIAENVFLVEGQSHAVMAGADLVLMASGTTTLEAMLLKKPMIVAYKMAPFSYKIISRLLKSKYISLPNLLANKALVPEVLQDEARPERLAREVLKCLNDPDAKSDLQAEYTAIHHQIRCHASEKAAAAVVGLYQQNVARHSAKDI